MERKKLENKKERFIRLGVTAMSLDDYQELQIGKPIRAPKDIEEALKQFGDWPSEETYKNLKAMYEAIPPYKRPYCLGDMDMKDHEIKWAINDWESGARP